MEIDSKPKDTALNAIRQASRAAKRGDLAAAERWTKNAALLADAAARAAPAQAPAMSAEEENAVRGELRARLAKFVACDLAIQAWEGERDAHVEAVAQAVRAGAPLPPPLRACPAGPEDLERIASGEDARR